MSGIDTDGLSDTFGHGLVRRKGQVSKLDARLVSPEHDFPEPSETSLMPGDNKGAPCLTTFMRAENYNLPNASENLWNLPRKRSLVDDGDVLKFEKNSGDYPVVVTDDDGLLELNGDSPTAKQQPDDYQSHTQPGIKAIYPKSPQRKADKPPVSIPQSIFSATEYKMDHPKRGKALVINNMHYADQRQRAEREDSIKDATAMVSLLERLMFEPVRTKTRTHDEILANNVSSTELMELLMDATDPNLNDYRDYDCFVMMVLSYGINGAIMCCEGETDRLIPVEQVISQFTADKCPSLTMKPKLFFMQLCPAFTYNIPDSGRDTKPSSAAPAIQSIPTEADILYQISTIPGIYGWYADDNALSWYIEVLKESFEKNLCEKLRQNQKSKDIMDILLHVNRLYLEKLRGQGIRPSQTYSTPQVTSTLLKQLYFKPKEHDLNS